MPTEQDGLGLRLGPRCLPSSADCFHSLSSDDVLFFGHPPCFLPILRQVREENVAHKSERDCDDAVDDEQPTPYLIGQKLQSSKKRVSCALTPCLAMNAAQIFVRRRL